MITIKDFMETVDYRITEGSDYLWSCFGPDVYRLDSWDGRHEGHSVSVLFDRKTQTVYQLEAHDYAQERSYRWTHPEYRAAHIAEAQQRSVDVDQAWDHVRYVDIGDTEDILRRAVAIVRGEPYDATVDITIDMDDKEWFQLMLMAHERNITLNALVNELLTVAVSATTPKLDQ